LDFEDFDFEALFPLDFDFEVFDFEALFPFDFEDFTFFLS